ncbi:MAG: sugar ABC transporter ATP-binding protein [Actinomycetales bacterium]|nr:sugar ABC transporter ATP-binding protein [Actinomycetales bacterium]
MPGGDSVDAAAASEAAGRAGEGAGPVGASGHSEHAAGSVVLELRDVSKSFGPVTALRSGSLTVRAGSIHALVGENGAGKSTLVKIVAGVHRRDGGTFELHGQPVDFASTAESKAAGVAVIYQEPTLFPDLSVMENIFMGRHLLGRGRRIDRAAMHAETQRIFDRLGVRIDPRRPAEGLSIADQQIIEIAKAISLDASLLVMDEPTAALSGVEVDRLFAVARSLRDEGRALVFISHRFDEVFALCDMVTVMRDGDYISTEAVADTSVDKLVAAMVGREVSDLFPKTPAELGDPVLQVRDLSSTGQFHDISFEVRAGEIVALAGLVGAGRSEVARAVFGVDGYDTGEVAIDGKPVPARNPSAAIRAGMGFIPEDRRKQGLVIDASVSRNVAGAIRRTLSRAGLLTAARENAAAATWASRLEVKTSALDMAAATMSGGNQQKVVIAKWLATRPRLLIIDEPTRGIDVGTKAEVHRLLSSLAGEGLAILMISSELPEVLGMADRVLVMCEGGITAELDRAEATAEAVMHAATHAAAHSATGASTHATTYSGEGTR